MFAGRWAGFGFWPREERSAFSGSMTPVDFGRESISREKGDEEVVPEGSDGVAIGRRREDHAVGACSWIASAAAVRSTGLSSEWGVVRQDSEYLASTTGRDRVSDYGVLAATVVSHVWRE